MSRTVRGDVPSKDVHLYGGRSYVRVPLAARPGQIDAHAWNELGSINDAMIERVSYDHRRAADPKNGGFQYPE